MSYLIGIGYDAHRIVKNRKLFLGGIEIKEKFGLKGYSDGDVVIHSVCDAILSAIGQPDIGEMFPDNNPKYKDIDSKEIAKNVTRLLNSKRLKISNIDIVVICEKPKISEHKQKILSSLKKVFNTEKINIKGKTTEGIQGFKDYIQCYSVVLIKK